MAPAELETTRVYGVVALDGGTIFSVPDAQSIILPGFNIPVSELTIDQVSRVPLPLVILFGVIDIVQVGGVTGGTTTTGAVVTEALQEFDPAELVTTSVYEVVVLNGGIIFNDPEFPRITFPGFRVPVSAFIIDQVRRVPLPLAILFGLTEIVQVGGLTILSVESRAKYEK